MGAPEQARLAMVREQRSSTVPDITLGFHMQVLTVALKTEPQQHAAFVYYKYCFNDTA